jgi:molybdenum cofactor cytidylyltransferase
MPCNPSAPDSFISSPLHPLTRAFDLHPGGELVSFTGGGGKTSLLFALSRELSAAGKRVVGTTTTRIATAEVLRAPAYCLARDLSTLEEKLQAQGFCVVVGGVGHDKAKNVPLELPAQLLARPGVDYVLVEADGAKMLPVKAPDRHEPAVPPQTTLLVPVVGIDALSAPLEAIAHRPRLLAALLDISLHETLAPHHVAHLLTSEDGALRNAPPGARIVPLINKVESEAQLAQALAIARLVFAREDLDARLQRIVIGAVQSARPVREIAGP